MRLIAYLESCALFYVICFRVIKVFMVLPHLLYYRNKTMVLELNLKLALKLHFSLVSCRVLKNTSD